MSYLGWLKITASRPGAARKAATRGAAGWEDRVWCAPALRVGPRRQRRGHSPWIFTVGSRAGRGGLEAAVFLGFQGEDGGVSWGQRAQRAGPRTKAWARVWGWGSALTRRERPVAPFPVHPRAAADGAPSPAKARLQPERRRHVVELEWFVLPHFPP